MNSLRDIKPESKLILTKTRVFSEQLIRMGGEFLLFITASLSAISVIFIIVFIAKDGIPFFQLEGGREFFTSINWYPSREDAEFGALSILFGSVIVTVGAFFVAVPLGISASVCISEVLSFKIRQIIKPVIELLAVIPSVVYGFFALVIFAPFLQEYNGKSVAGFSLLVLIPLCFILTLILSEIISGKIKQNRLAKISIFIVIASGFSFVLFKLTMFISSIQIESGTNAFNVSVILGIMALPTIVSVSEDALQSVSREFREGSYALGATKAETVVKVVIPAAFSGVVAAVILGVMRALGETMVVWMASGNSAHIPKPFFNIFEPVRTLTATIAGDMGEADHITGSARYHVLFAMALILLIFSFISNLVCEWIVQKHNKKMRGE